MNNNKKVNAERVWKQLDDDVVPQLKLSVIDHAVYSYLLRHSRLEGKLRIRFAGSHPRPRARSLLLLLAPGCAAQPVPRPRRAARKVGPQFLSQPRVLLSGVQLQESGAPSRRVSALAVA